VRAAAAGGAMTAPNLDPSRVDARARELFAEHRSKVFESVDRMFGWLLVIQWLAGIVAAVVISPRTWIGQAQQTHVHVWAAFLLGAAIISFPLALIALRPGQMLTRHTIAVAQMLASALLIHLTGGRIETHFHVFGSLAFLAFYRDGPVLLTAAAVVAIDHFVRGVYYPQSVFGVLATSPYRWIEHAGWVLFENAFLLRSCRESVEEMWDIAVQRAQLEATNEVIEREVERRTQELEQSQERLRHAEKMDAIGQLAGGTAHDFNNILTVVGGHAEILLSLPNVNERVAFNAQAILKGAQRGRALTRQLLTFSRKQVVQTRVLELNALIADVEPMLKRLIGSHVELTCELAPDAGRVQGDPNRIEQVLLNLIVNARDAMPKGGRITVRTERADGHVMLSVRDTGIGIDEATRERIFEPFFTTKPVGKGTGLGLATVYSVVQQLGGRIDVKSEPGAGACFEIHVPRVELELTKDAPSEAAPASVRPLDILLVEDDAAVRAFARVALESAGHRVVEADGPEAAIKLVGDTMQPIDMMITDVMMPKMNGVVVAEHVSAVRPGLKVLYISGYTDDALAPHASLPPFIELLEKPFTQSALNARVARMMS
jgi:two-component system sensor histidine kinase/response regulator